MTLSDPEKPKQARSLETREKIIETGAKMFSELGYHATSSKRIAKAAGVATGTFYNHFKDKRALLLEIHRRHSNAVHQEIERFFSTHSPGEGRMPDGLELMKQMVDLVHKTHQLSPELHREINILSLSDPDFEEMDRLEKQRAHEKIRAVLAPYRDQVRISDAEAAHHLISETIEAIIHGIIMSKPSIDSRRILDALADMLNRYLFE